MTPRTERRQRLYDERIESEAAARQQIAELGPGAYSVKISDVATWKPESVSAVICDPPYIGGQHREHYGELARFAADVLPDGGHLAAMCSVGILADVLAVSTPHLNYRGTVAWMLDKRSATQHWPRRTFERWKPVVILTKGSWKDAQWCSERHISEGVDKELHPWQQSLTGFVKLVRWLSKPGELVATPFCGSGTVGVAALAAGRRWTGCDVDPVAVETTRQRLSDEQYVAPAIVR